ncbi:alpha/beta fold hydrolase [Duganella sp. FT135W]|uniref:Alpha/beta fold hydrolase n=1 Tax=Duganella flavida TaxID=2692175 RepID=A0A6L8KGX9_9BURK|nr:alpha/beta hydrolase [Duganella flavida]MYM26290.1 alpha/beta fold hydrolase [Duganella flavida]
MSKPTLLLLPGLLCDATNWSAQCEALNGVADCIVPVYGELRSIEAMAEYVLELAPVGRFSLAGHSMGGRVALEVMRYAPERVERLALLDTGFQPLCPGESGTKELLARYELLELARAFGMRDMGKQWARGMVHPSRIGSAVFESILDMIARSTPDMFEGQIHALLSRPDATSLLPTIRCPTLLLCGREDLWSPLNRHEEMQRAIPGSTLEVIEMSGHMTTMEQPQAVSEALMRWLRYEATGAGSTPLDSN